jgi:hypothetical protein
MIETVRLLALSPGSIINEHRDMGLGYEDGRFRLHIPITTDADVSFVVDGCRLQMDAGQCWYANFSLPHAVHHNGTRRRIHLVIDGLRNDWTDRLFASAGYNFQLEKQSKGYDHATKMGMIKQLRMMDTDTARAIIASLEADDPEIRTETLLEHKPTSPAPEPGWIPVSVQNTSSGLSFRWVFVGDKPFTEPFFHDTLSRARSFEFNKNNAFRISGLRPLHDLAQQSECLPPEALVFHVSRCGSTLLSQLLCEDEQNVVLSEVPLLDALLRLPYQDYNTSQQTIDDAILSVIHLLGRKRKPVEKHLYIKMDSWHIFFYDTLRRLFPETPFILLYRRPDEVIRSHQKQRGLQSIPSSLESGFTGIHNDPSGLADLDGYLIRLLEQIFAAYIHIQAHDHNTFLVNYNQGTSAMLRVVEKATGIRLDDDTRRRMESRSRFHAKRPTELFEEEPVGHIHYERMKSLMDLYTRLDQLRK